MKKQQSNNSGDIELSGFTAVAPVTGHADAAVDFDYLRSHEFLIKKIMNSRHTATLVRIHAVTNNGEIGAVGSLSVEPLVNQVDGKGVGTGHGVVHGIPYARTQGGVNAIIVDPKVGDVGIAVFCDRDISGVKSTGDKANPGSARKGSYSDGVYLFSCFGGTPKQFIQFTDDGMVITSPLKVTVNGKNVEINAETQVNVNTPLTIFSGDIEVSGRKFLQHIHKGVNPGGGNTQEPV